MKGVLISLSGAMALVVCVVSACGGVADDGEAGSEAPTLTFTGLVTDFTAASLLEFESIVVVDETGAALEFHSKGRRFAEFTPSHIREHMLLGQAVEVVYRESGSERVIVSLRDAPAETPETSESP